MDPVRAMDGIALFKSTQYFVSQTAQFKGAQKSKNDKSANKRGNFSAK